jgi:RNA polymerase sigma factor (sigma-70 family)
MARVDGQSTPDLVERALDGHSEAWSAIVTRFQRLVWAATYGFGFDSDTRNDVFQLTWLRLLDRLPTITNPERLAGWLSTTARRECIAVVRSRTRTRPVAEVEPDRDSGTDHVDAGLIRNETVREVGAALADMSASCQQLLRLLVTEPPLSYEEISALLGLPIGSIGPTRARCLDKLRRHPTIVHIRGSARPSDTAGADS